MSTQTGFDDETVVPDSMIGVEAMDSTQMLTATQEVALQPAPQPVISVVAVPAAKNTLVNFLRESVRGMHQVFLHDLPEGTSSDAESEFTLCWKGDHANYVVWVQVKLLKYGKERIKTIVEFPIRAHLRGPAAGSLELAQFLMQCNLSIDIGCVSIDSDTGTIFFRSGYDVDGELSREMAKKLVSIGALTLDRFHNRIIEVVHKCVPPSHAVE